MLKWLQAYPQRVLWAVAGVCGGLLAYGLYLQHVVGLVPCPMCIVQRYALFIVAVIAALTGIIARNALRLTGLLVMLVVAGFGAFTAARQSWLQWYPPEVASCGRDFYGMIEAFPLQRVVPMIFKGSGDCTKIDWTFLGLSIANWSFLWFVAVSLVALVLIFSRGPARYR